MKVRISKFRKLIGLIKTLDELKDKCTETSLRALKTLTSKKACEQNNPSRIKVIILIYEMLIGLMKTLDQFKDGTSGTTLRALKTLT